MDDLTILNLIENGKQYNGNLCATYCLTSQMFVWDENGKGIVSIKIPVNQFFAFFSGILLLRGFQFLFVY